MKNLALIIGALIILGSLLLSRKKAERVESNSAQSTTLAAKAADEAVLIESPDQASSPSQDNFVKNQLKTIGLRREVGFQKLPFKKVDNQWTINVHIQSSQKMCEPGDLDLIRIDQKRREIESVLLSLENLNDGSVLGQKKLNISSLPISFALTWKGSDQPRALGLFICSDAKGAENCSHAKVGDMNKVLTPAGGKSQSDNVYYFQYIQEGEQLEILDSSRQLATDATKLQETISGEPGLAKDAKPLAETISRNLQLIGSMIARPNKDKLIIDLPHNDPSCVLPNLDF